MQHSIRIRIKIHLADLAAGRFWAALARFQTPKLAAARRKTNRHSDHGGRRVKSSPLFRRILDAWQYYDLEI